MVKWSLLGALCLAGLGLEPAYAQNGTLPILIDYPADGSVFPPDMAAPTFLWRDPAPGAVSCTDVDTPDTDAIQGGRPGDGRPNILLVVSDQERQRGWLPPSVELPWRDRLMAEGLEFTRY